MFCLFWGFNLVGFLGVVFLLYFCFFVKMLSSMNVISSIPSLIVIADAPNLPCISWIFFIQFILHLFCVVGVPPEYTCRCLYTKSNPIDDHSNISSKRLQKQNFKPLGDYTYMQCGTSHLQTVQENILSHTRKFTLATQNVICNIYTDPKNQQVANVTV